LKNTSARLIHPSGLSGANLITDEKSFIAASAFSLNYNEIIIIILAMMMMMTSVMNERKYCSS